MVANLQMMTFCGKLARLLAISMTITAATAATVTLSAATDLTIATDALGRPVRIGVLTNAWGPPAVVEHMVAGLAERGFEENGDFAVGVWFTEGNAVDLGERVGEMVAARIDIAVAVGPLEADAIAEITDSLPTIFLNIADPIAQGLIRSYPRPGGNMTGIADAGFGISARRLQVFAEMVPSMATVLLPISALNAFQRAEADAYQIIAARLGLTLVTLELDDENPAEVLEGFIRLHDVDGIIAPRDVDLNIPGTVVQLATRLALPSMFEISPYVQAGGLASYGYSEAAAGRQIARMIEAIIGGAHPRDIPVEPPASIELVINMATAERLGLSIPMVVFSQVDRVVR